MSHTLDKLYPKLHDYSDFSSSCLNANKFIKTALAILKQRDPKSVPILFRYFRDEPKEAWVFEKITLFMEHFYGEEYPLLTIKNIESLTDHAPDWACTILIDTLKTPNYREVFYRNLTTKKRSTLSNIIHRMEKRYACHKEFLHELVLLLQKIDARQGEFINA